MESWDVNFFLLIYLFIYFIFWVCWVFVSVRGLSLVVASGGHTSSRCAGLSLSRPLLLRNTGSRRAGSVIVAHGPSCSAACGIFPDQGSNPCLLHWQAGSQPLHHQGSPRKNIELHNRAVLCHWSLLWMSMPLWPSGSIVLTVFPLVWLIHLWGCGAECRVRAGAGDWNASLHTVVGIPHPL